MKISKQQWMLIAGIGVLALVYWFFFRKKKTESSYTKPNKSVSPCPEGKKIGKCHKGTRGEPDYLEYDCCKAETK